MTSGITSAVSDPQAPDWDGLAWSEWQDFDEAHRDKVISTTLGIYRFRRVTAQSTWKKSTASIPIRRAEAHLLCEQLT